MLTVTVDAAPPGIVKTAADSLVIDTAAAEKFSLNMTGVEAGRTTVTLNATSTAADVR